MPFLKSPAAARIGLVLSRGVVPAWVLLGAAFKLSERTPSNLPSMFVDYGKKAGIELGSLLHTLIGLEFLAVAVMVLLARLARPMALFMLSSFCLILIGELYRSATSCGCFGKINIHPGVVLAIDGTLLVLVALFKPATPERPAPRALLVAAVVAIAGGFTLSFAMMQRAATVANPPAADCLAPPPRIPDPNFWYVKDGELERWIGLCWNQIDLFQLLGQYPDDIARGRRHVVFYRRDCEHCQEMFDTYFTGALPDSVVAYRIPSEALWELPQTVRVALLDLPEKPELIIETPLVITLEDGKVVCAAEGEGFEKCLEKVSG